MTPRPFDVVVVPFPFTDKSQQKRRPALVLSSTLFGSIANHSVMAMITSEENAGWPLDVLLQDLASAGLSAPSVVRMKLFTLDHRFIIRHIGELAQQDRQQVLLSLNQLFAGVIGD
ncbi:MAG: type II toxin-antitoxin system PemK/MazF family toxin [Methylophilaceae bacterium]